MTTRASPVQGTPSIVMHLIDALSIAKKIDAPGDDLSLK